VAEFLARGTLAFACGFPRTRDQAAVRDDILQAGEGVHLMHFIAHHEGQDFPSPGDGTQAVEGGGVVWRGGCHDRQCEVGEKRVVGGDQPEVDGGVLVHRGLGKALGHAVTVSFGGDLLANLRPMVLAGGRLDMGQELGSFAHELGPAAQEGTGGTHLRGIAVGETSIIIKALEPTPYSLRCAPAFGRGSPLALGVGMTTASLVYFCRSRASPDD
jgi:hypothetical protein